MFTGHGLRAGHSVKRITGIASFKCPQSHYVLSPISIIIYWMICPMNLRVGIQTQRSHAANVEPLRTQSVSVPQPRRGYCPVDTASVFVLMKEAGLVFSTCVSPQQGYFLHGG